MGPDRVASAGPPLSAGKHNRVGRHRKLAGPTLRCVQPSPHATAATRCDEEDCDASRRDRNQGPGQEGRRGKQNHHQQHQNGAAQPSQTLVEHVCNGSHGTFFPAKGATTNDSNNGSKNAAHCRAPNLACVPMRFRAFWDSTQRRNTSHQALCNCHSDKVDRNHTIGLLCCNILIYNRLWSNGRHRMPCPAGRASA